MDFLKSGRWEYLAEHWCIERIICSGSIVKKKKQVKDIHKEYLSHKKYHELKFKKNVIVNVFIQEDFIKMIVVGMEGWIITHL